MNISNVSIKKIEKEESKLRGIATIVFNDCFAVHDIRIIEGKNGLFIAMPSRQTTSGEYMDIAHPIKGDTRELIEKEILKEYKKNK